MTISDLVFSELRDIARLTRRPDDEVEAREKLIRFLGAENDLSASYLEVVDALLSRLGLYPYMTEAPVGTAEQLALEMHVPPAHPNANFVFHSAQKDIFDRLIDDRNVILSAPTSFGKSAILDSLVASGKWSKIAIIVPTNALIDETRRRIRQLGTDFKIVTHPSQGAEKRTVYILTQERFLQMDQMPEVELFVLDEFYKLSPHLEMDNRAALLNLAWSKLRASGAQYYLIGPNIDALASGLDDALQSELVVSNFKTVAVDVEDRSGVPNRKRKQDLLQLLSTLNESTLVFTAGPAKARSIGEDISGTLQFTPNDLVRAAAEWMGANYDPDWLVARTLLHGVGVHYGPLPRSIQRIIIRLFNEEAIPVMVCTSTLIEGVNTAARSVVIYDKAIDNQTLDFFTFNNIRGRAGRMFRHFVGRVYTYMAPPDAEVTEVDIPIETQSRMASLATLIQLDRNILSPESLERLEPILRQTDLSVDTIRRSRGVDPQQQVDMARAVKRLSDEELSAFSWTGMPGPGQTKAVLRIAFDHLVAPKTRTFTSFESIWAQLNANRVNSENLSAAIDAQAPYSKDRSRAVDDVMKFKRNWMGFTLPSLLQTAQHISEEILPERGLPAGNFELLIHQIESMYLAPFFAELEDYGLPLPMALRLQKLGLGGETLDELLASLRAAATDSTVRTQLSTFERWVIDDVVLGL